MNRKMQGIQSLCLQMSRRVVPILNSYKRPPDRKNKAVTSRDAKATAL